MLPFLKAPDRNPQSIKIQGHLPQQMDISWEVREAANHRWSWIKAAFTDFFFVVFFVCIRCSRCQPLSTTAPALSTRWATGSWGWRTNGGSTWSNGTPSWWGTRPHSSPTRLKFRAGITSAGVQNPELWRVTQERTVSSKLCLFTRNYEPVLTSSSELLTSSYLSALSPGKCVRLSSSLLPPPPCPPPLVQMCSSGSPHPQVPPPQTKKPDPSSRGRLTFVEPREVKSLQIRGRFDRPPCSLFLGTTHAFSRPPPADPPQRCHSIE